MRKAILASLLTIYAASAVAESFLVAETPNDRYYLDFKTIRKDGNLRKAWVLLDFKEKQVNGTMSRQVRYEYDCKGERFNILSLVSYAESMGQGNVLSSASYPSASDWRDIVPGTTADAIFKILCVK